MEAQQKIQELKSRINNDEFRKKEMEIKENKRKEKLSSPKYKKKKLKILSIFFIVMFLYFAYTAFTQQQMIKVLDKQIAEVKAKKEEMQKKSIELKNDVAKIDNKEILLELVEKVARNEYKMVKPNEIIYIDKNKTNNKLIKGIGYEQEVGNEIEIEVENENESKSDKVQEINQ